MNDKHSFIERLTGWLMPDSRDPDLAADARKSTTLDGVYSGRSTKILRLVALAYLRGVRRGASCAWDARQPVHTRGIDRDTIADALARTPPPDPVPKSNMLATGKPCMRPGSISACHACGKSGPVSGFDIRGYCPGCWKGDL